MRVHWMRYLIGDAGHLKRLYWAVRTASEYQSEQLETLCEIYLRKYRHLTAEGSRKKGLLKSRWRSAEPHFSFARELDLIEWRERWRTTFGAGRSMLNLWSDTSPPVYLFLHQALTYDRTFLVPFLTRLVEADYDFAAGRFVGLEKYVKEVWQETWDMHHSELLNLEPPLPNPSEVKTRTLLHHAAARIRFLNRIEGLGLNIDKLNRLVQEFHGFEDSENMPSDSFFRIGKAISGQEPVHLGGPELTERILRAFYALRRGGHASGYGTYLFVNEQSLPEKAVDWQELSSHVRREFPFSTRTSFRREDFLVTVEAQAEATR